MGLHGGQRLVGGHPAGSILQLLFFQSPNWKCLICCEKGLQGKKKHTVEYDILGARTASRSSKMCCMGKECSCAGSKTASQCSSL